MTKAVKYWILATIMCVLGLVEAVTGFVLWLGFPAGGSGAGKLYGGIGKLTYWGITKHTWIDIHDWVAIALVTIVVLHIVFHWKWLVRVGRNLIREAFKKPIPVPVRND
ncbi:DUF4405 domain-containing protein [Chloroflexota bacterium]